MAFVQGPDNELSPRTNPETGKREGYREIFESHLTVVSEILPKYCEKYGSDLAPYDGSWEGIPLDPIEQQYFFYRKASGDIRLVDIHVRKKNGQNICIKQNLEYVVESEDVISLGQLIC